MIALIPSTVSFSSAAAPPARVTLPKAQFIIPHDDRSDTAPRGAPIRSNRGHRDDRVIDWAWRCAR